MSADQVAAIRPTLLEAMAGAPGLCATLEVANHADKWVQFMDHTLNAAYPFDVEPLEILKSLPSLPGLTFLGWESQKFATFETTATDALMIARWIDAYFVGVLACPGNYDLNVRCEEM